MMISMMMIRVFSVCANYKIILLHVTGTAFVIDLVDWLFVVFIHGITNGFISQKLRSVQSASIYLPQFGFTHAH